MNLVPFELRPLPEYVDGLLRIAAAVFSAPSILPPAVGGENPVVEASILSTDGRFSGVLFSFAQGQSITARARWQTRGGKLGAVTEQVVHLERNDGKKETVFISRLFRK